MWTLYSRLEGERRKRVASDGIPVLKPLVSFLGRARRFGLEAKLPAKDRRKKAELIAKHAHRLGRLLKQMADEREYPEWLYGGSWDETNRLLDTLEHVEKCATRWAIASGVQLWRPTSGARTFFVHSLARSFQRRYGGVHPNFVAALTKVFFHEGSLSTKEVADLLRERPPRAETNRKK